MADQFSTHYVANTPASLHREGGVPIKTWIKRVLLVLGLIILLLPAFGDYRLYQR